MTPPWPPAVGPLPCSVASADAGEPLYGTAVAATSAWLLLDVRQPWGPRGLEDATLPSGVKEHLEQALQRVPSARPQLIRPCPGVQVRGFTFMVVIATGEQFAIHRFRFERLEELLEVDVVTLLQGRVPVAGEIGPPLALVCTHGRRDRCCARHGPPIAKALMDTRAMELWQTTHLGGHRFAPTLLFLPDGVAFGRLQTHEIPTLVSTHLDGRIELLDRYRGRTFHDPAVQAADYFVRRHTGVSSIDGFRIRGAEVVEDRTMVTIDVPSLGTHLVALVRRTLPTALPKSCDARPEPVGYYALQSITGLGS